MCCLFEKEEEHRALLTPFLRLGLERGEKIIYIVDAHTAETVLSYLRDDGFNVEPCLASGQLNILPVKDSYLREGVFDPDRMIALLRSEMERALAGGYLALRVTGEMSWALQDLPGVERLIEYEAKLNEFFPGSKCLAMCQYNIRRFNPSLLLDVLTTHPIVVVGTQIYENLYYVPSKSLLGSNPAMAKFRRYLDNLSVSERRYRELADSLPETVIEIDDRGNILLANHSGFEAFGYNPEDFEKGLNALQMFIPEDRDRMRKYIEMVLSGGGKKKVLTSTQR